MAEATTKKTTAAKTKNEPSGTETLITQVQEGGQQAIGAVRRFLTKVDESVAGSNSPTIAHDIADSALEMSDRMVESGSEALRGLVKSS